MCAYRTAPPSLEPCLNVLCLPISPLLTVCSRRLLLHRMVQIFERAARRRAPNLSIQPRHRPEEAGERAEQPQRRAALGRSAGRLARHRAARDRRAEGCGRAGARGCSPAAAVRIPPLPGPSACKRARGAAAIWWSASVLHWLRPECTESCHFCRIVTSACESDVGDLVRCMS